MDRPSPRTILYYFQASMAGILLSIFYVYIVNTMLGDGGPMPVWADVAAPLMWTLTTVLAAGMSKRRWPEMNSTRVMGLGLASVMMAQESSLCVVALLIAGSRKSTPSER